MVELIDTHCHIHDAEFSSKFDGASAVDLAEEAKQEGVVAMVCVGTDLESSKQAVELASMRQDCYATLSLHPHEASKCSAGELRCQVRCLEELLTSNLDTIVAIGECGLDYYYHESVEEREKQQFLLKLHLDMATAYDLPLSFHIRDDRGESSELGSAFKDFFAIVDGYSGVRGVIHSFTATNRELQGVLDRGFYVGLNGIITFTKQAEQLEAAMSVPLERLVLETDAPFLTPEPFRGKMCKPKHVRVTAEFLAGLRSESFEKLARATTDNARKLFDIK